MATHRIQHVDTAEWIDWGLPSGSEGGTLYSTLQAASTVDKSSVGDRQYEEHTFAIDGVDGTFSQRSGRRGRTIAIEGTIRAKDAAFVQIRSKRDDFRGRTGLFTYTTPLGETYEGYKLAAFEIDEPIPVQADDGMTQRAGYRIRLEEMQ